MTVTRGKKYRFLGMEFTFNNNKAVSISKENDAKEFIQESKINMSKTATSPAKKDLLDIDESLPVLPEADVNVFHSILAKFLFV
jgi:hypothetical protein